MRASRTTHRHASNAPVDSPPTVLVTGASGFIGGRLAGQLVRRGRRVRALVRATSDTSSLAALGVDLVEGDLCEPSTVREAAEGCEVIYHLGGARLGAGTAVLEAVNVGGTRNVMRAAADAGVDRVVFSSSSTVYGRRPPVRAEEGTRLRPDTAYAATKVAAEAIVRSHAPGHPRQRVIARPVAVFGPGNASYLSFFRSVISGRIRLAGAGRRRYQLSYVEDVARAITLCGERDVEAGSTYNVGADEVHSVRELVRIAAEAAGVEPRYRRMPAAPLAAASLLHHALSRRLNAGVGGARHPERLTYDRVYSVAKARRELGFRAEVTVSEGIRQTLAWHRACGHFG